MTRHKILIIIKLLAPKLSDFFKAAIYLLELAYFQAKIAYSNLRVRVKNNQLLKIAINARLNAIIDAWIA
jgi:hypothetical protein